MLYNPFAGSSRRKGVDMATAVASTGAEAQKLVLNRYDERIAYYWKMGQYNKRSYKTTRYLLIVLGAVVTLISSLSSANFIKGGPLDIAFAVLTPVLAATMAIVSGVSQSFQWGAAWSDMAIMATRLEKERDRIAVTAPDQVDALKEMATLDDLALAETQGFFQRLFGPGAQANSQAKPAGG
jgi:hypothetical protein